MINHIIVSKVKIAFVLIATKCWFLFSNIGWWTKGSSSISFVKFRWNERATSHSATVSHTSSASLGSCIEYSSGSCFFATFTTDTLMHANSVFGKLASTYRARDQQSNISHPLHVDRIAFRWNDVSFWHWFIYFLNLIYCILLLYLSSFYFFHHLFISFLAFLHMVVQH